MFQGTGSGVGKSVVSAAFCYFLRKMGIRVAPFKAQNMALNSYVTHDGLEMGRAQVYQAEACGVPPDVRMNPILLKPSGDCRSQVIRMGLPCGNYQASDYYRHFDENLKVARQAFDSLARDYDAIVLEGAGSPAEINLQDRDLVNMKMAAYASSPVLLVGDIHKGGVFAWLKGTYDLIEDEHKPLVAGWIINKFRGDVELLKPGVSRFSSMIGLECLGILPWFDEITVDQEDGMFVHETGTGRPDAQIRVACIHLPRISNFTDLIPLGIEEDVSVTILKRPPGEHSHFDLVIIPGSKNTRADLEWIKDNGWDAFLDRTRRERGIILGICGGFQILGQSIRDPGGQEGVAGETRGLGLLPIVTTMAPEKRLTLSKALFKAPQLFENAMEVEGYEIHMGITEACGQVKLLDEEFGIEAGVIDDEAVVIGTYFHGLFDNDLFRRGLLNSIRRRKGLTPLKHTKSYREFRAQQLERLGRWFENSCDAHSLLKIMGL